MSDVKFKSKGKEYTLEYDFNSLIGIEEVFGVNFLNGDQLNLKKEGISLRQLREYLFIGLQAHHSNDFKNAEEVGRMIEISKMNEIIEKIAEAILAACNLVNPDQVT